MTVEQNTTLNTLTGALGVNSKAALALYSPAEIYRRMQDAKQECDWSALQQLHAEAKEEYDDLQILEKSILTRASPLLPKAIRLGLKHPGVSLQDYEEWFGERASQYASPGDVSSVFSPAAYLAQMYHRARTLYPEGNTYNIDMRRPDLKSLVLSQKNMDTEVSALALSNELLLPHVRSQLIEQKRLLASDVSDDTVLKVLSEHVASSGTPYHHHHARLRQVRQRKDPDFSHLQAAPRVLKHLTGPSLAGLYYNIPPRLYTLLTDEITEENAEEKFDIYFGNTTRADDEQLFPEQILQPDFLRKWYGLTDEEVRAFVGSGEYGEDAEYVGDVLICRVDEKLMRLQITGYYTDDYYSYVRLYPVGAGRWRLKFQLLKTDVDIDLIRVSASGMTSIDLRPPQFRDEIFIPGKVYETFISWPYANLTPSFSLGMYTVKRSRDTGWAVRVYYTSQLLPAHAFVLKLNKAIRLYKATGLSPQVLEDIVNSVDPNQITDETLTLLFRTQLLMQRYGLSHEAALVMAHGNISLTAHGAEPSQWDRLFNTPSLIEGGFSANSEKIIDFDPAVAGVDSDIKATLKRACQTDDQGMWSLVQCAYHKSDRGQNPDMSLRSVSCLYTLSLWARLHALTPSELHQLLLILDLPDVLQEVPADVWNEWLDKVYTVTQWLKARNWTVHDLHTLTRDVGTIPASTEIKNFIQQVSEFIVTSELPDDATDEARISRLAPLIAAVFSLNSDTAAAALLHWVNQAEPAGMTLRAFWLALGPVEGDKKKNADVTAFAYCLAQMALIYHGSGVTPDAIKLFVEKPLTLDAEATDADGVLGRNVTVIRRLCEFSKWLSTLNDAGGEVIDALSVTGIDAPLLARASDVGLAVVQQAMSSAESLDDLKHADRTISFGEVQTVLQWCDFSASFNVMPVTTAQMLSMDYTRADAEAQSWDKWKQLADDFAAGLTPLQTKDVDVALQGGLSSALCGFLLNSDSYLALFVENREMLYQYLLADNLNGSLVTTSRLAEAMSALQTFIHRTLLGPEGAKDTRDREAFQHEFFLNWTQWNSRYSHWGAYRRLMYYPENYLDPTVRLGQTRMMDDMLQILGQGQINADTVGDGFLKYLTDFEDVANLDVLRAYHDNPDAASGKTWFIGRDHADIPSLWWRTVDEGKRDSVTGQLPANAWTGWEKINNGVNPYQDNIRPVVYKSRLYLVWLEQQFAEIKEGETTAEYRWLLKVSSLRYDKNWTPAVTKDVTETLKPMEDFEWGFYVSFWMPTSSLLVLVHKLDSDFSEDNSGIVKAWSVFDNLTIKEFDEVRATVNLISSINQLQKTDYNPVINQFVGSQVYIPNNKLTGAAVPDTYTLFGPDKHSNTVDTNETDEWYNVSLQLNVIIKDKRILTEAQAKMYRALYEKYTSDLENLSSSHRLFITEHSTHANDLPLMLEVGNNYYFVKSGRGLGNRDRTRIRDGGGFGGNNNGVAEFITHDGGEYTVSKVPILKERNPTRKVVSYLTDNGSSGWTYTHTGHTLNVIPNDPALRHTTIPKDKITLNFDGKEAVAAQSDWVYHDAESWRGNFTLTLNKAEISEWAGTSHVHTFWVRVADERDTDTRQRTRKYTFTVTRKYGRAEGTSGKNDVYINLHGADMDVTIHNNTQNGAQYLQFGAENKITRLNTLFARSLTERAEKGIPVILSWYTQLLLEPPLLESDDKFVPMDFAGANSLYFWELFYYTPMMVMERFLQEERFDQAETWLRYIFDPSGYFGESLEKTDRLWNVRPLEEDTSWNDSPLDTYDPDAVAQNDPMHYKLHVFMRQLDILIGRGDSAYRKLERDTLAEAKVWYTLASNLLGEEPWIERNAGWGNPTLLAAANTTTDTDHVDAMSQMAGQRSKEIVQPIPTSSTPFLMEANSVMLGYWETLRLRMYNLRHNLTIDGQPMNLPLYAPPADPKALLAAAVAAEGGAGSELPSVTAIPALRFTPMLESARSMASQLIQFGGSMQQILLSQDAEALAELLATQGAEIAASSVSLQKQTLEELAAERITLEKSLEATITRRNHYQALYQEDVNAREIHAMNLLTTSQATAAAAKGLYVAGAASGLAPNIFGFANGGMKYEGPLYATGQGIMIAADALNVAGTRIQQEEQYRRRREEWDIQYRLAEKEMAVIEAQLAALRIRETSAQMQIAHMETQAAHADAQLALFQSKFTGKAMYSWLRGRLATIFYQYYDLTASLCLMAQKSLQYETGDVSKSWLKTGTWNGAWAGLMSGEGLMLSLAQMEMAWMKHQKRELEVTRTVSLAALFDRQSESTTFVQAVKDALNKEGSKPDADTGTIKVELVENDKLAIHFSLSGLNVAPDYADKTLRVRSIAVTLPALLGPYQNVMGQMFISGEVPILPSGCERCAISHALQDNGMFSQDGTGDPRWGARWLPFEGLNVNGDTRMTLSFAEALGDQKTLLESLSDIILHVQFTVR